MNKNIATLIAFVITFIIGMIFGIFNAFMSGQAISVQGTVIMSLIAGVVGAIVVRMNAFKDE